MEGDIKPGTLIRITRKYNWVGYDKENITTEERTYEPGTLFRVRTPQELIPIIPVPDVDHIPVTISYVHAERVV
jgi:hypothetical protein